MVDQYNRKHFQGGAAAEKKAIAWYTAAYVDLSTAVHAAPQFLKMIVLERTRFRSFPWLIWDVLTTIKWRKHVSMPLGDRCQIHVLSYPNVKQRRSREMP